MKFIARSSKLEATEAAVAVLTAGIATELGAPCHLAVVFVARHRGEALAEIAAAIRGTNPGALVLGVTAESTLEGSSEMENAPSMALLAANLPGVHLQALRITQEDLEGPGAWTDRVEAVAAAQGAAPRGMILFADPFSIDIRALLDGGNTALRGVPLVGGLASGGRKPGENHMHGADGPVQDGVVGVALYGNIVVETLVSQGCRPFGTPLVVTKGITNVVHTLRGRPALEMLREALNELPPEDGDLVRNGLFVGRAIDEYKSQHGRGDFLISGLIGADPKTGVLAIAGEARTGMTVQFHLRDAASADEDLKLLLEQQRAVLQQCKGALLFSCNGRGRRMWSTPHHDAALVHEALGDAPLAGFFAAGELGPVGPQNFVHGFTASLAAFREA